jgi:predicted DNA binding CopG/RHH family protein
MNTDAPVHTFSDEYLERCSQMSTDDKLGFLDNYRKLHGATASTGSKSKLISMKVPEDLLESFRYKCQLEGVKYQTQIKNLMKDYLVSK